MTNQLSILYELAIPLPITASFRQRARAYSLQYFTQSTHERIYLNTLAVLVADAYFRMLGFETNLTRPERWNAAQRLWSEATELELVGLGNLECCVLVAGQQTVIPPPEAWENRIGYLFIEIADSEKEATLVGFLPAFHPEAPDEEVAISALRSMDNLIDYLAQPEAPPPPVTGKRDDFTPRFPTRNITYLRNWLNNIYDRGWELARRGLTNATCKKKIQLAGQAFEMELTVSQSNDGVINVTVRVRCESGFLPVGMEVSVPDEPDTYTETVNAPADFISIPLELSPGEEFWVEMRIGETFIREYFIA